MTQAKRYVIVDIGSNTIRAVVYEGTRQVRNESIFAGLIRYVQDNAVSEQGMQVLLSAIHALQGFADGSDKTVCFATASLRFAENASEVVRRVKDETGWDVRLLSADEEAYYDYLGLTAAVDCKAGLGGDLGGGSLQLYTFAEKGLAYACSMPLGSLKLHGTFVRGTLPTKSEATAISDHVLASLAGHPKLKNAGHETLYLTGGSIRAILKLWGASPVITAAELDAAIADAVTAPADCEAAITAVAPERVVTVVPALLILRTVLAYTGANRIVSVMSGVREGVLKELMLGEK